MSLVTTKIANCPAYIFRSGDIQDGERVDTDIFFSGRGEMASQTKEGLAAIKKHGQPKFFTATWPKRIVVAIQYPNLTYNATLIDAIVKEVKAIPNVGSLYATGLSQGAIWWGKVFLSGDDGARASQFKGCFLMSGSSITTTKAANFKNLKTVLFGGTLDTTVPACELQNSIQRV
jgi:predicted peptidase